MSSLVIALIVLACMLAGLLLGLAATGKAQLAYMKAEIDYRVAHAQLMQTLGQP